MVQLTVKAKKDIIEAMAFSLEKRIKNSNDPKIFERIAKEFVDKAFDLEEQIESYKMLEAARERAEAKQTTQQVRKENIWAAFETESSV